MKRFHSLLTLTVLWLTASVPLQAELIHRYSFTTDANDSIGAAHGVPTGAATISGGALSLNGGGAYLDLPDNLVTGYTSVTFETWVLNSGSGSWARVWDFGNAAGVNMFLTWPSGNSNLRAVFNQGSGEQQVNAPLPPNNSNVHIVFTQDGSERVARLYVGGVLAAENTGFTLTPAAIGVTANDWLGRSQYSADPYFVGRIDEFRIYDHALSATEVAVSFNNGPDTAGGGPVVFLQQPASQTVIEGSSVAFHALVSGTAPITYQWFRDDVPIPGATQRDYSLPAVTRNDNGVALVLQARNTVSNEVHVTNSTPAVLTVLADTNPPVLLKAITLSSTTVRAHFSERIRADSVTNAAQYQISSLLGPVTVSTAALDGSGSNVVLQTGPIMEGPLYTLTLSGVRDASSNSNLIAPGSSVTFYVDLRFMLGDARLKNRYSFAADPTDSVGGADGELRGGAFVAEGSLVLDGASSYLNLPNNLVTGLTSITIEAWLIDQGSGSWSRIYDFGNATAGEDFPVGTSSTGTRYMFLTPLSGSGTLRGAYTITGGGSGEQIVEWGGTALPGNTLKHVVMTSDAASQTAWLYVDAVQVGRNVAVTITPASMGSTSNNWIGRSLYSADPFLRASIAEFRIYDGSVGPDEVRASTDYGPDRLPSTGPATILQQPASLTVLEQRPATFTVAVGGYPVPLLQWLRDGIAIPGATNPTYTVAAVPLGDDQVAMSVIVSNVVGGTAYSLTSSNAVLTVLADHEPPLLTEALSTSTSTLGALDGVVVRYSERLSPETATNTANYQVTGPAGDVAISGATLTSDASSVILATLPLVEDVAYTVTVSGVRDAAEAGNLIQPNSQVAFVARAFTVTDFGDPGVGGSVVTVPGGYDVTGGGTGPSGSKDQLGFSHQLRIGDFDMSVRLAALGLSDDWARAGLMARDDLSSNALFAATFATPGPAGCFFSARPILGASASTSGSFPVNYPYTWLRLRRTGDVFDGFASLDGRVWEFLGSSTIEMPATVYVGLAVSSGSALAGTTADFRDFGTGGGIVATNGPLPFEPPGPCSRRTALVITEIMYNPLGIWAGSNNLEFVELWNSGLVTEDLTGHRLGGEIGYEFPPGTKIVPGQFLVVARDPAVAQGFYGVSCLGPFTNNLANNGGALYLLNELGGRLLEIDYANQSPWPVVADGTGHSLVLSHPSYGENDPRAWSASDRIGGSPGRQDGWSSEPGRSVVINEFLANTDNPLLDYVELFNASLEPVDLSGAWLSDDPNTNKFRLRNNTVLPGRGFVVFDQSELGFALSSAGEQLFLVNSNRTRVLDAIVFGGQASGVSSGRYPDGTPDVWELAARTPAEANAAPLQRPLVMNEIMYHPIAEANEGEYIELYNRGSSAVALADWRIDGGIRFTFPPQATIAPGGYVVVAENRTNLLARYPQLNSANTFGDYNGALGNGGERLVLFMPQYSYSTNAQGVITTNILDVAVNEVNYLDGGRWGQWSDGGGSSLELTDPYADNRFGASWADSDESAKAGWTVIDVTNILENGQTAAMINQGSYHGPPTRFEFFLHDAGEAIVDDLEFRNNGGPNLVANGDFVSGTTGYSLLGTLRTCFAEAGVGPAGSQALHLVATDRGDAGANKVATPFTANLVTNAPNTGTIRAKVRWLKGSPYILFRTRGHWMEVSQRLSVPGTCGTPGLPNSRLMGNAGPVITGVSHAPVLPAAHQAVVVTARVLDPDDVGTVALNYRLDPEANYQIEVMNDDGVGSDAVAGDGIYSAPLPGQAAGTLGAFYLSATDAAPSAAARQFPPNAPIGECLVRWGETVLPGAIGTYRIWLTESNIAFWGNRERNANDPIDATFVYGNSRVIYNADTLYSGSPFHSPNNNGPVGSFACDYELNFHPDDKFLGSEPFVLTAFDVPSGNFFLQDKTGQVDLTGNWIARQLGQPYNYRRHVHLRVNGLQRGTIYDDAQQPNGEVLDEYFPDDQDGELRKIEDWFEFADDAQTQGITTATMQRVNRSTGGIDPKRYRWTWRPRVTDDPNHWYALTNLILAVNDTSHPNYLDRVRGWLDVPNILRPIVAHHICGDWDSYGYERGKNMYAYKPDNQPWRFLMWDIELALGAGSRATTDSIYNIQDSILSTFITANPAIQHEYLGAFLEAVNSSLVPGAADALLDERYASFLQNGVPMASPQSIKDYIAGRRAYLLTQLPVAAFAVTGTNVLTTSSNLVTLRGTAPVNTRDILVNGAAYPLTWVNATVWTLNVSLEAGSNPFALTAMDRSGAPLGSGTVVLDYAGTSVDPEGQVVINEIMFNPVAPQTSFIELLNRHPSAAFDLSGWRVNGLQYQFPGGSVLPAGGFLILGKSRSEYFKVHRTSAVIFHEFPGALQNNGETLALLRPGAEPGVEVEVDKVKYEARAPWPAAASQEGASLQLVDGSQDNARVSNWDVDSGWRFFSLMGIPGGTRLLVYPASAGTLIIDDLKLVAGSTPEVGANYIVNGDFEAPFGPPWRIQGSAGAGTTNTTGAAKSGAYGLEVRFTAPGSGGSYLYQDLIGLTTTNIHTLSFYYRPSTNISTLNVRLSSDFRPAVNVGVPSGGLVSASAGQRNTVLASLPPYPLVWLNEVLASNASGRTDNQGTREPWIELFNSGLTPIALEGFFLSDDYGNLARWPFPAGAAILPGEFKVLFADAQPEQSTVTEWHTSFALQSGSGSVALSRLVDGAPQILDYLNYDNLGSDQSYGSYPDGQLFKREVFHLPTPGTTNSLAQPPLQVFINEWMAANAGFIRDPADNDTDDWFELHNAGPAVANLEGCTLTDDLANPLKFPIPTGYVIPSGGFLLVWADEETGQNNGNRLDLHVNFKLSQDGEDIALYAPDGTLIDHVTFGPQTDNASMGRQPDGATDLVFFTNPTPGTMNPSGEPPTPTATLSVSGDVVTITWTTTPGLNYRVQYTDALALPDWRDLAPAQPANGPTLVITDTIGGRSQRFYRVIEQP